MQQKISSCALCHCQDYSIIHSYSKPDTYEKAVGISEKGYWRHWVQCKNCQFFYSLYSRAEDSIDKIYRHDYRNRLSEWRQGSTREIFNRIISLPPEQSETKYRTNWIKAKLRDFEQSGLISSKSPPLYLLDIGGASGVFAYEFRDRNWKPKIVDPSEDGQFIQPEFDIEYRQQPYISGCFDMQFDLISLNFVLEHFPDPIALLWSIHSDLKKEAFVYVEVPDALSFKYKPADDDIFNSCHLWFFSTGNLVHLMNTCGYEIFSLQRMKTVRGHYSIMLLGRQNEI